MVLSSPALETLVIIVSEWTTWVYVPATLLGVYDGVFMLVTWLMAAPVHFTPPMFEYFSAHLATIDATRTLAFRRHFADNGALLPWYRRHLQQTIDRLRGQYHLSDQALTPRPHPIAVQTVFDI